MTNRILHLALEDIREGHAGVAHIEGIASGLERAGWSVARLQPRYHRSPSQVHRVLTLLKVQARAAVMARRWNILYLRGHFAALPIVAFAKMLGKPVVQEVNGPSEEIFVSWPGLRKLKPLIDWSVRRQFIWSSAVVTVTPGLADWVRGLVGHQNVHVVPNAADPAKFHPAALPIAGMPDSYALFFGTLSPWQGIPTILEAAGLLDWPDDVHLVIAGDGKERGLVEDAVGRNAKVRYFSHVDYSDMPGLIANSLCTLITKYPDAHGETGLSPIKLYESAACGVPVVVSNISSLADFVHTYDCGIVVPPRDAVAIAASVAKLYSDEQLRAECGKRARQAIESEHSWSQRAIDTASILDRLNPRRST